MSQSVDVALVLHGEKGKGRNKRRVGHAPIRLSFACALKSDRSQITLSDEVHERVPMNSEGEAPRAEEGRGSQQDDLLG